MPDYIKGFEDCLDLFERSIQMVIDNYYNSDDEASMAQGLDSIISTLYIAKLDLNDMQSSCDSYMLEKMLGYTGVQEENIESVLNNVYKIFKGDDLFE